MYKLEILPIAKEDIKNNARWYNEQQAGVGLRFTQAIRNELKFIRKNPLAIVNRYRNAHTCVVYKFPYMIHYIIEEGTKTIVVIAVFKTQQSPDKWDDR